MSGRVDQDRVSCLCIRGVSPQLQSRPVKHPPPLQVPNCVVHLAKITSYTSTLNLKLSGRRNNMTILDVQDGVIVVNPSPPLSLLCTIIIGESDSCDRRLRVVSTCT